MLPHISISRASVADATALTELSIITFRDAFGPQNEPANMDLYLTEAMTPEKLESELADTANHFFLAYTGGTLAGYAKVRPNTEDCISAQNPLEIERLYVHRNFQNRQVGRLLVQHCFNFAAANLHHVIWLGVWEHNPNAIRFYQRLGFHICGSHPFLLGTDLQTDVLMQKTIIAR